MRTKELRNPPMPAQGVRVAIVLGAEENFAQGEGPQFCRRRAATLPECEHGGTSVEVRDKLCRLQPITHTYPLKENSAVTGDDLLEAWGKEKRPTGR